jgi:hypothetical protein
MELTENSRFVYRRKRVPLNSTIANSPYAIRDKFVWRESTNTGIRQQATRTKMWKADDNGGGGECGE